MGTITATAHGNAKLTISMKRRLPNGDEVFIAPGVELGGDAADIDETIATVTEKVNGWMEDLLATYPDADPIDEADEEEEEADEEEEPEEEEGEEEDELTEADVKKMTKKQLEELAEEFGFEFEETTLAKMRKEAIDAIFAEDEEGEEEEEPEDEEGEDEEGEEEEGEAYDEDELKELKLEQLQEILTDWEIDHPTFKKGTSVVLKKKAYVKAILEAQEEE